jgi:hypothetical protein
MCFLLTLLSIPWLYEDLMKDKWRFEEFRQVFSWQRKSPGLSEPRRLIGVVITSSA